MNTGTLLPKLALTGIWKNRMVYLPYILTTSFSVCVFFIFNCILHNKVMENIPHAMYVMVLLQIGIFLLGLILAPFLFYTNSFLIKRRKKELGLYSILGLEKKHISMMLLIETLLIYALSLLLGIVTAIIFSKLVFLILLNVSGLPIDTEFTVSMSSFKATMIFFGIVSLLNVLTNLFQVTRANPAELLRSPKQGEKEPKHLWIFSILGVLFLGSGYAIAAVAKLNGMIFLFFFLAVLFVVIGTYYLFTAGSIVFLRILKRNKKFYYKKENYITVSGMIYRMKKSAASLVNICIFSTMIIITLLCTISLSLGEEDVIKFRFPYDVVYVFDAAATEDIHQFGDEMNALAFKNDVNISDKKEWNYYQVIALENDNHFSADIEPGYQENQQKLVILTVEAYNRIEGKKEILQENEVLIYSTAKNFGYDRILLNDQAYRIKSELKAFTLDPKEPNSYSNRTYYIITSDLAGAQHIAAVLSKKEPMLYDNIRFNMEGEKSDKEEFLSELFKQTSRFEGWISSENAIEWGAMTKSMNGGLLFIGVFFGLIFTICLVLIMYYKQIAEGFEDRNNFEIMQQVGMSDEDVKVTIRKQILLVFSFPLIGAIIHTFMGLHMIINLLYALNLYNTSLIVTNTFVIIAVFAVFYGLSYLFTAKSYYRIVRQSEK
ncbi:FtsX-like permease family protein [Clostridium aminobutyricum]|uniref:ABC transporter permease n=1 Tax=Clostridium aminobutyricum TaxID=33953 RepID=A0A939II18_CLOAM|nr:ABC transporter permease [Clostridium aminobutyricum]MBN7772123.1 ABC transporter permease [Clostridium aminobutyricum]